MNTKEAHALAMLLRVDAFMDSHGRQLGFARLPARVHLKEHIETVQEAAITQARAASEARGITNVIRTLRQHILDRHFRVIFAVTRAIAHRSGALPGFVAPTMRESIEQFITHGRALAGLLTERTAEFEEHGVSANTASGLRDVIDALEKAVDDRYRIIAGGTLATAAIRNGLRDAKITRGVIDAMVHAAAPIDLCLLEEWHVLLRSPLPKPNDGARRVPCSIVSTCEALRR